LLAAVVSILLTLGGRIDATLGHTLSISLACFAIPKGMDRETRLVPERQGGELESVWVPRWWIRNTQLFVMLPVVIGPIFHTASSRASFILPALILSVLLLMWSVRGPETWLTLSAGAVFGVALVLASGPWVAPLWAWCIVLCMNRESVAPLKLPAPSATSTDLDDDTLMVFYDGVCGLCHRGMRLVLAEDETKIFYFAPLQGETASRMLGRRHTDPLDTMVLHEAGRVHTRSAAALRVAAYLGGVWRVLAEIANFIAPRWRDNAYNMIASGRYRWFGKLEICSVPSKQERERFRD
jgi:predicted DCC family thiol-disulfide oxidoreductase YuxK